MKDKARLIYKTSNTCFPEYLPVYFYGLPNQKMLVLYTRERQNDLVRKSLEWVVAAHLEFRYDYQSNVILDHENQSYDFEEFKEYIDQMQQRTKPLQTYGTFHNWAEAEQFYNSNASQMLHNPGFTAKTMSPLTHGIWTKGQHGQQVEI